MHVFLTGATGYIGGVVAEKLRAAARAADGVISAATTYDTETLGP